MRLVFLPLTCAACCLVIAAVAVNADESKPATLTARDVLDRMAKAYENCKAYRDSGVVKTVIIKADGKQTIEKPFTTAFVRPDRFRFEFKDKTLGPEHSYIVWRKADDVRTWWDLRPGVVELKSLSLALAGATGVSGGSAHTIPTLLLPAEISGRRLTDMTEEKRIDDAQIDEADCFRIEGKFAEIPITIWIDKTSFLLRRINMKKQFDTFRTEDTTTYEPVIDEEIPAEALEFNPPKEK